MRKVLNVFGILIAIIVIGLSGYNNMILTVLNIPDGIYEVDNGEQRTITVFDNGKATIYVFVRENGSVRYGAKYIMKASGEAYNHLFGDLYFKGATVLSIRKIENGKNSGRLYLDRIDYVGMDFSSKQEFEPLDHFQGYWDFVVNDDSILLSEQRCDKVDSITPQYQTYVKHLDSLL